MTELTVEEIRRLKAQAQEDVRGILYKLQADIGMPFSVEIELQDITTPSPEGYHISSHFHLWDVKIVVNL